MTVLVTGGAGYIGSHTCVELLKAGKELVVFDNFCNSKREALARVEQIAGRSLSVVEGDIRNAAALDALFQQFSIESVIHFAGLKAVGESALIPLHYYDNNVSGTVCLLEAMERAGCFRIVFSSSATVYGDEAPIPYVETLPVNACNVYGRTKLMVENILRDCCSKPDSPWVVTLLRYFNPIGAHSTGLIGEDPQGIPNNLLPYVAQVAVGKLKQLQVFGGDYPTRDGTGVRDYIHVVDLALGHLKALQAMSQPSTEPGCKVYNLGAGKGFSVLEVIKAFEQASGKAIAYEIVPRRSGDLAEYYANADLALAELGWQTTLGLEQMVADTWRWQSNNPNGY